MPMRIVPNCHKHHILKIIIHFNSKRNAIYEISEFNKAIQYNIWLSELFLMSE